jgi:hypothetical protein
MNEQELDAPLAARELIRELARLRKVINRQSGVQLSSLPLRDDIRAFVQLYFRSVRLPIARLAVDVAGTDSKMQRLLELANRNSSVSLYKKLLTEIGSELSRLEIEAEQRMSDIGVNSTDPAMSSVESRILETLGPMLPSTARSYRQVLMDLASVDRVSYRGTATELREILREALDHLAPDKDVMASSGFQLEKDRTKPTMAQKARYILRLRGIPKNSIDVPRKSIEIVEDTVSSLVRSTYDRGSIDTHTSTGISKPGVDQLKMYVDSVLCELLEIHGKSSSASR